MLRGISIDEEFLTKENSDGHFDRHPLAVLCTIS